MIPHLVDRIFDEDLLRDVLADAKAHDGPWRSHDNADERKQSIPWPCRTPAMEELRQAHIGRLDQFSDLVGACLIDDPKMTGAGCHIIPTGGHLNTHIDFNQLHGVGYRRLNVLTYLNPEWVPEHGGVLEVGHPVEFSVQPRFGVTAAFATSETSWHGHGPTTVPRYSFAFYAYSLERPDWFTHSHSTVFR